MAADALRNEPFSEGDSSSSSSEDNWSRLDAGLEQGSAGLERKEAYRRKLENILNEFESALAGVTQSAREAMISSLSEDEGLKKQFRRALLQVAAGRRAAYEAAALVVSDNDFEPDEELREIALISAAAAKMQVDGALNSKDVQQRVKEDRTASLEQVERAARRVLRVELAFAKRIAEARRSLLENARREMRELAHEVHETLLCDTDEVEVTKVIESRPHVLTALISGNSKEIEIAFQVLLAPVSLYARYYGNVCEVVPRLLLVLVGASVLVPQPLATSEKCKDVVHISGISFLPLSGWLAAQILCDILIIIARTHMFFMLQPVVRAFARGEGAEHTQRLASTRSAVFSAYLRQPEDGKQQHPLEALLPLEETNERGERALLAMSRVSHEWPLRRPLAVLTVISFCLGLAGGIYLLLPFRRSNCQPGLLLIANAYIAFFYIFLVPNVLIVAVALADIAPPKYRAAAHNLLESSFLKLDQILFLDRFPICTFVARHILLGTADVSAPIEDRERFATLLARDVDLLYRRRTELQSHLNQLDNEITDTRFVLDRLHNHDQATDEPAPSFKRYTQRFPEVTWRTSFVPVLASRSLLVDNTEPTTSGREGQPQDDSRSAARERDTPCDNRPQPNKHWRIFSSSELFPRACPHQSRNSPAIP